MLIDSHCHVLSSEYDDTSKVISDSFKNGVNRLIINGYDLESSKEAVALSKKYENVYAAIGIGPENVDGVDENVFLELSMLVNEPKVVAIGEIGLDYYWTKENKDIQINVFEKMIDIAKKNNLPVIVHNREATKDVYNILKESKLTGIMHCFSGSLETAKEFIKLGFLIGIGGVVTFKNANRIKDVVKNIPLASISLETDSPYLAPHPYRGKRNEPSNIVYVAKEIALLKDVSLEEVIEITGEEVSLKFDL